jgi:very-short-patch-repair endonuclease
MKKSVERISIITGQRTTEGKVHVARELRRNMTAEEQSLWYCLRASKLGGLHFRRQQIIDGFVVDFYCHGARLVVELDGEGHQDQIEYDEARDRIIAVRGLRILRIPNKDVRQNLSEVLRSILQAAKEAQ